MIGISCVAENDADAPKACRLWARHQVRLPPSNSYVFAIFAVAVDTSPERWDDEASGVRAFF